MHLAQIDLLDFKNYEELSLGFSPKINVLVGVNGIGKTNLLDAVYHLCLGKSAFNKMDQQNIRHGAAFYMIKGVFEKEGKQETVRCSYQTSKKKSLRLGEKEYERISDHVGHLPIVLMSPSDADLVREGSEIRRKYFDSILGQLNKNYLQLIIRYSHTLKQRNALLKHFAELNYFDADLMAPYNAVLIDIGKQVAQQRQELLSQFEPIFQQHYQAISQEREAVSLSYDTQALGDDFEQLFTQAKDKDLVLKYTTKGIHRDDYGFGIEGYPLKKFGSQGQQKSFVVALKLAQFDFMHQYSQKKPILLMDDIFDKLDDHRMSSLLELLSAGHFGQVFITDARPERSKSLLAPLEIEANIIDVGKVV